MTTRAMRAPSGDRDAHRRAWLILGLASACFALLLLAFIGAAAYYYQNATAKKGAVVQLMGGSEALYRSNPNSDWNLIDREMTAQEGDEISTALGTIVWLRLFDGSTVEIAENSVVRIDRMRSSRFLTRTKEFDITVLQGSVYIVMEPRSDYRYSETRVSSGDVIVEMSDEATRSEAGAFLVEAREMRTGTPALPGSHNVRTAVLRGAAIVSTPDEDTKLFANEQVLIEEGDISNEVTPAIRNLIWNGSFEYELSEWVEFSDSAGRADTAAPGVVELRWEQISGEPTTALEISRLGDHDQPNSTGVRQRIGQTLRVPSSLELRLDLRINAQNPPGAGVDRNLFPLKLELNYVDIEGEERRWERGYYIDPDPDNPVPLNLGSKVEPDQWHHVVFDLNDLQPLPQQISSIVVYASGVRYQVMVANIALTTSEQASEES